MTRRPTRLLLACAAATLTGLAAGTVAVPGSDGPPEPGHAEGVRSEGVGARAADPAGGPGWAVRVYRTESGRTCIEPGRADRSDFGRAAPGGGVEHRAAGRGGACSTPGADGEQFGVLRYAATDTQPARTVVFGQVFPEVAAARLRFPGAAATELPLGDQGTFIAVLEGLHDPSSLAVEVQDGAGTTRTLDWE